jgi:Domain of unknown function (DUF4123)
MTVTTQAHSGAPEHPEHLNAAAISTRLFNLTRLHDSRYECIYLLLDRHSEHPLKDSIEALPDINSTSLPLLDEIFQDNPEQSPLLLCLQCQQPPHMQLLEQSIALALEQASQPSSLRSMCAWIVSDAQPKRLQNALTQSLKAHWPGNQSIYLRYFDPRVLPRLIHILPPEQQAQLLGLVHIWCQLGRDGQWITHWPADDMPISLIGGLRPSANHAAAIDRIELVNLAAAQLARRGNTVPHSQDETIDHALQAAQKLGITSQEDTVAYAWRAVLHHKAFTAHPALPQLIQQAITSGLRLDTLLEDDLLLMAAQSCATDTNY